MDTYQAVYDAVRSRIGNVDIDSAVRESLDFSHVKNAAQMAFTEAAADMSRAFRENLTAIAENAKLKAELAERDAEVRQLREERDTIAGLKQKVRQLEGNIGACNTTITQLDLGIEALEGEVATLRLFEAYCHCGMKMSQHHEGSSCTSPQPAEEQCPYHAELKDVRAKQLREYKAGWNAALTLSMDVCRRRAIPEDKLPSVRHEATKCGLQIEHEATAALGLAIRDEQRNSADLVQHIQGLSQDLSAQLARKDTQLAAKDELIVRMRGALEGVLRVVSRMTGGFAEIKEVTEARRALNDTQITAALAEGEVGT